MHNNISALYIRHITSLSVTRFYDIREPHNVAQQHQCNVQKKNKKKKIEPNCTITSVLAIAHLLDQINQKANYNY